MRRTQHQLSPIDTFSRNSDLPQFHATAASQAVYQGTQPEEHVDFSTEAYQATEEHGEDLCCSLLDAWS